ncbi:twin-arginine translocase subunit TatC [Candidatus Pyrohabitans sp.]
MAELRDREMPLEEHLTELRQRLLISLAAVVILSLAIALLSGRRIITLLVSHFLPAGVKVIALNPMEYAYTWFLVVLFFGIYLALPVIIYEAFRFAEPGLYPNERRFILKVVPTSFILFTLGVLFSFFILTPFSAKFLVSYAEGSAEPMLSLHRFISFIAFMLISAGIIFQIPLVVAFLIKSELASTDTLRRWRRYVYLAFLALSITLAPDPTPVTPLVIAATLILIFELSLVFSKYLL